MLVLIAALMVCNLVFIHTAGWLRLFWNLFGYISLFLIYKFAGLKLDDIGLSPKNFKSGLKYSAYLIALIAVVLVLVFIIDSKIFQDPRYHHALGSALYSSLVLLPLKTVFFEELAFRGFLLSLLFKTKNNRMFATIASSLLFGLWHIGTAGKLSSQGIDGGATISSPLTIFGVFIVTTLAGIVFCELRWRSKSLVAPIAVHWFINGIAIVLAALSWS